MDDWLRRTSRLLLIIVLSGGLLGLLLVYGVIASDLPARVYTVAQQEYLDYQDARSVNQAAPVWNVVLPGGEIVPAALADWQSRVDATLDARYQEQSNVSVTVYDLELESEYSSSTLARPDHHGGAVLPFSQ
jgi:hypothetical protein